MVANDFLASAAVGADVDTGQGREAPELTPDATTGAGLIPRRRHDRLCPERIADQQAANDSDRRADACRSEYESPRFGRAGDDLGELGFTFLPPVAPRRSTRLAPL